MMFFFESRYYRYNAFFLLLIGQWPYQSPKWQRLQQIIIHVEIFSVMIVQVIKLSEIWGDVDIMIECCTPVVVQTSACIKSINNMINREKITKLLEHMKRDWSTLTNEKDIKILRNYAEDGRTMTLAYAIFLVGTLIVYLLVPMMPSILDIIRPLNESRQRKYLYQTEYYVDPEKYFYAIVLHTYVGTTLTICTVIATDAMFAMYVQHVCGLLAIIGNRLENTSENLNFVKFDVNVLVENDEHYPELIDCIKRHQEAIKFAVLIESTYSSSLLLQLGLNMLLISISLLQLLTKLGQYDEMYRIIQFISAQMFHLFFNSWPGQKLMNQSAHLSESIYLAGWYGFSLRSRNLIKIAMMRAAVPLKITASRLYDMSMENFGTVLQTSISYFTVLASLR